MLDGWEQWIHEKNKKKHVRTYGPVNPTDLYL